MFEGVLSYLTAENSRVKRIGHKSRRYRIICLANFDLGTTPKIKASLCTMDCRPNVQWRLNQEYTDLVVGDPRLLKGKWRYVGSARKHQLTKAISQDLCSFGERWLLFSQSERWVVVFQDHVITLERLRQIENRTKKSSQRMVYEIDPLMPDIGGGCPDEDFWF
jgi:hypothetical protein